MATHIIYIICTIVSSIQNTTCTVTTTATTATMLSDKLSYSFDENPVWRDEELSLSTSEMIQDITERRLKYEELSDEAKRFCTEDFARAMAVDYVHFSNVGEMVGTQNKKDTERVLNRFMNDETVTAGSTRTEKETMNTYEALKRFYRMHETTQDTGYLTVQEICNIHKVLLKGVHPDCGQIRTYEVYTRWRGGEFFYPPPSEAEDRFYALVDNHNIYMEAAPSDKTSVEYTDYIFKCAARLLFEFVDAHPFGDGNGRMCRLLANYVITLITPFPVFLYDTSNSSRNGREDYINVIVRCREHPVEGPGGLAAMLVEGAWRGWENLFQNLQWQRQLQHEVTIGPIVVKKSACDAEHVSDRVGRSIKTRGLNVEKDPIVELILGAIQAADVSSISRSQYIEKTVAVDDELNVELQIFN